ncbi:hypothetical protein FRB99_000316, partial [Tulasnella sp. 403]
LWDVARGLKYLHNENPPITHGNIHPRNILVCEDGRAVLSDFKSITPARWPGEGLSPAHILAYASLEAIGNGSYAQAIDVWAWACIAAEVLTGRPPYQGITGSDELVARIHDNAPPYVLEDTHIREDRRRLLRQCWNPQHEMRPGAELCATAFQPNILSFTKEVSCTKATIGCLSPDGKLLALLNGTDPIVSIYSTEDARLLKKFNGHEPGTDDDRTVRIHFSGDSQKLVQCISTEILVGLGLFSLLMASMLSPYRQLWDISSETVKKVKLTGFLVYEEFKVVEPSVDGKLVATTKDTETVKLWHANDKARNRRLASRGVIVSSIAFSPNSCYVVAGAFASDGQELISFGDDWAIRMWKLGAPTRIGQTTPIQSKELMPYDVHTRPTEMARDQWVVRFSVSPGGKWVVLLDDWIKASINISKPEHWQVVISDQGKGVIAKVDGKTFSIGELVPLVAVVSSDPVIV